MQVARRDHHLLCALHQQSGKADRVGLVFVEGLHQLVGRHLDAQIDHLVAVVREDDLHQVLADIVHVALHRGQDHLAARLRFRALHELLEVAHGGLHGFGRLQHLRHNQLIVVKQPADLVHAHHQRPVDDVERRGTFGALAVEILDQAVLGAFDDVVREALVERQVLGAHLARARRPRGNVRRWPRCATG